MTILGCHVAPDQVIAWTDSEELTRDGQHSRFRNKMAVSPAACMIGMSAGWASLGEEAERAVARDGDLDRVARVLPERLRQRTMKNLRGGALDPREAGHQITVLAGWSEMYGRMVAYELTGSAMFEAVLIGSRFVPAVADATVSLPTMRAVGEVARGQMLRLRTVLEQSTGGPLVVATIRPGIVETRVLLDLAADFLAATPEMVEA